MPEGRPRLGDADFVNEWLCGGALLGKLVTAFVTAVVVVVAAVLE